ncbi:hypothetical protein C8A01DRAFT_39376 [Parachaetomium inaequale]|uniref:Fibroin-3 related protein n=1 Tax=Parachaetomium inaequale TaxID=2588326 RepID=A0AAN6PB80_9PEZI|nr:hypothetical protein C8A01DRAFT_39376 [Parachaetomium inaequale]
MPAVDVAMERSLRRGFLDLFVASLRPALARRDVAGQISDVKTAFSSWDNCMLANYCKWPVIAVIIVGGLIILAVAWCMIRCLCCGLSCCCSCFSCLKCCGDCCGCCDPPRGSRRKYLDEPYIPPNHGYKSQEPMHAGFGGGPTAPVSKGPESAQFAQFDAGGKKNEDALPQMPSWEGSEHKKVLVEEEAVEMNALKKPDAGGQAAGAMSPNGPRSPINRSPYGPPSASPGPDGFFAASAIGNDPYAQGAPAYNQPGMAYSKPEQGYGMAGAAMGAGRRSPQAFNNGGYNDGYNNNNNHNNNNNGYGQAHDYPDAGRQGSYDNYGGGAARQQPYDNYDNYPPSQAAQGYGIARHQTPHEMDNTSPYAPEARRSPAPQGSYGAAYGPDSRRSPAPAQGPYGDARRSPAPQSPYGDSRRSPGPYGPAGAGARRSPAPQQGGDNNYARRGSPAPQQQQTGGYGGPRAPPQRQYSSSAADNNNNNGMHSPISGPSPLRNDTAGFDFTSGYSRPPAATATSPVTGPSSGYRQPSPPAESGGGSSAYPGYKPYQP